MWFQWEEKLGSRTLCVSQHCWLVGCVGLTSCELNTEREAHTHRRIKTSEQSKVAHFRFLLKPCATAKPCLKEQNREVNQTAAGDLKSSGWFVHVCCFWWPFEDEYSIVKRIQTQRSSRSSCQWFRAFSLRQNKFVKTNQCDRFCILSCDVKWLRHCEMSCVYIHLRHKMECASLQIDCSCNTLLGYKCLAQ